MFGNRVDIGTNTGTSDFNPTALTIHELSNSKTTPALTLNHAPFDAVYGSSWQLIDVTTDNLINRVRQCSVNLINYNTTGGGQGNFSGRRYTGMGFSVSNAQSGIQENALAIRYDGNVGIGTTSPGAKLDVNGVLKNLNPSWSLYFAGSPSPTTSGYLSFNNIKVSARNCTLNTSGGRTSRVTITVAGRYFIGFNGFTESNVSANTGVNYEIRINGTTLVRGYHAQPIANFSAMSGLGGLADLSVNDYVEINSTQQLHHNQNASFYGFMIG
jgi:hypothetical protein